VLATTATANARVVADVAEQLAVRGQEADGSQSAESVSVHRGALARASLRLGVLHLTEPSARLAWLAVHLADLPGSGIIYALTVAAAEDTAALLAESGLPVRAYTGRTDAAEREQAEDALRRNEVKALAATSAPAVSIAGPRVRGASGGTSLSGCLLPAGRAGRAAWTGPTCCAARRGGSRHLAVLRLGIDASTGASPRRPASPDGAGLPMSTAVLRRPT
jgi:ATP-dependent DNA helicase RecQ